VVLTSRYRMKIARVWREFDLRDLGEVPKDVVLQSTSEGLIWEMLQWGLVDRANIVVIDQAPMRLINDLYKQWQQDSGIQVEEELFQILAIIDKRSGPLEADLIDMGMRLRDFPSERHTWHDLWVIMSHFGYHSHLFGAMYPERAGWDKNNMLLADIADSNNWLVWAKSRAAQEGGAPPDRIVRPGVKNEHRPGSRVKPSPRSKIRKLAGLDEPEAQRSPKERKSLLEAAFK